MAAAVVKKADLVAVVRDLAKHEWHVRNDGHRQFCCVFCGVIRDVEGRSRELIQAHLPGCLWQEARGLLAQGEG